MKKNNVILTLLISLVLIIIISCITYYLANEDPRRKSEPISSYKEKKQENFDKSSIEKKGKYNNPVIPDGFKKIENDTASWELDEQGNPKGWNNGLVIEDNIGNQFVWIPYSSEYDYRDKKLIDIFPSIYKYSGFYIARFEAGVPNELQNTITNISKELFNIEGIPVSKKGIIPWNYIAFVKAEKNAKNMYKDRNDLTCDLVSEEIILYVRNWLYKTNNSISIKNSGNFADSNITFTGLFSTDDGNSYNYGKNITKTSNIIIATGSSENTKLNNIYDFYGNIAEYFLLSETIYDVRLGKAYSDFYDNSSSGYSYAQPASAPNSKIGFRVALYLN